MNEEQLSVLERLCIYKFAVLNDNQARFLFNLKFVDLGPEIYDLSRGETEVIQTYKISDRGVHYCTAREDLRPKLMKNFIKLDSNG